MHGKQDNKDAQQQSRNHTHTHRIWCQGPKHDCRQRASAEPCSLNNACGVDERSVFGRVISEHLGIYSICIQIKNMTELLVAMRRAQQ
jgi:hypothetical protein